MVTATLAEAPRASGSSTHLAGAHPGCLRLLARVGWTEAVFGDGRRAWGETATSGVRPGPGLTPVCPAGEDRFGRRVITFCCCRMPPSHELNHRRLLE